MRVAHYYLNGCLLAVILAFLSPWWWLSAVFIWAAIALGLVAVAYYQNNPRIFGKRQAGRIPMMTRVLFWPFMFGVHVYNWLVQSRSQAPVIQEIEPGLYLASRLTPMNIDTLKHYDVAAILDATAEFDSFNLALLGEDIEYLNVPILDHAFPDFDALIQAIRWIDHQRQHSRNVVVHCALGRGRSVLVMAAYLLAKSPHQSVEQVLLKIQTIRRRARLNPAQQQTLSDYRQRAEFGFAKPEAWLIANPVSGGGKWPEHRAQIIEWLAPYYQLTIKQTSPDLGAAALAKQALADQPKLVIAGGGDGTINQVASQLVDSDIHLGILPLGTANSLAHALWGVKSKLDPIRVACDVLTQGQALHIDTALCNDHLALMVVAVGFEQQMIEFASREEKNDQGQGAYLQGFFNALTSNQELTLNVKFDQQAEQPLQTASLVIANAAPFSTILAQGQGEPDVQDGQLDVTWLAKSDKLSDQVWSLAELVANRLAQTNLADSVEHRHVHSIQISSAKPLKYAIDGELYEAPSIAMHVRPRSLWVLTPSEEAVASEQPKNAQ